MPTSMPDRTGEIPQGWSAARLNRKVVVTPVDEGLTATNSTIFWRVRWINQVSTRMARGKVMRERATCFQVKGSVGGSKRETKMPQMAPKMTKPRLAAVPTVFFISV